VRAWLATSALLLAEVLHVICEHHSIEYKRTEDAATNYVALLVVAGGDSRTLIIITSLVEAKYVTIHAL
jgi:hypothetical protein